MLLANDEAVLEGRTMYIRDGICYIDKSIWENIPDGIRRNSFFQITIIIPDGVQEINYSAFMGTNCIKRIVIPNTVKHIDPTTFCDCKNLEEIVLSDSLEKLHLLLKECKSLKRIFVPKHLIDSRKVTFDSDCEFDIVAKEDVDESKLSIDAEIDEPKVTEETLPVTKKQRTITSFNGVIRERGSNR